jgi:hypothetical protein
MMHAHFLGMSASKKIPSRNGKSLLHAISNSSYLDAINYDIDFPVSVATLAERIGISKPIDLQEMLQKLRSKPLALIFNPNSAINKIEGHDFPADMPPVRWPEGYDGCSRVDLANIRKAWVFAHYFTWRAYQVMEFIARNDSHRKELWDDGYIPNYGSVEKASPTTLHEHGSVRTMRKDLTQFADQLQRSGRNAFLARHSRLHAGLTIQRKTKVPIYAIR